MGGMYCSALINRLCAGGEILRLALLAQDDKLGGGAIRGSLPTRGRRETSSAPVCRRAMLGATGHLPTLRCAGKAWRGRQQRRKPRLWRGRPLSVASRRLSPTRGEASGVRVAYLAERVEGLRRAADSRPYGGRSRAVEVIPTREKRTTFQALIAAPTAGPEVPA